MSNPKQPGAHSLEEILSQPTCWNACFTQLEQSKQLDTIANRFRDVEEWVFVGCGSSYYVALSAAATMTSLTGLRARAVPASEILLFPDIIFSGSENCLPVLISRSGQTSEVIDVAELLRNRGISTLAISCADGQPLEELASETIIIPADEQSTVMTRSFTSMLLTLQALAARVAGNSSFMHALQNTPDSAASILKTVPTSIREFCASRSFADYVYLGQGPFYGLACEGALKVTEMSVSYAQSFHTLEFRHGPKSIVGPETLLVFLLSENGYQAECEALHDMKSLGATTIAVTNRADTQAHAAADLLLELKLDVPELARLGPYLFAGQLLGLYTGIKKGFDPDSPRNLSRVVLLDEERPRPKPEHASI